MLISYYHELDENYVGNCRDELGPLPVLYTELTLMSAKNIVHARKKQKNLDTREVIDSLRVKYKNEPIHPIAINRRFL